MWFVWRRKGVEQKPEPEKWSEDYERHFGPITQCILKVHLDETWAQASLSLLCDKYPCPTDTTTTE